MSPSRIPILDALLSTSVDEVVPRPREGAPSPNGPAPAAQTPHSGGTAASDNGLRARRPHSGATEGVLSAPQFDRFLERECNLADRGTRRFSLLVLDRIGDPRSDRSGADGLGLLALESVQRLRSTDLVGRLGPLRLEILLTDTAPAGAQVVAAWVERAAAELGLHFEPTMYVYPSVTDPPAESGHDQDPRDPVGVGPPPASPDPSSLKPRNGHVSDRHRGQRGRSPLSLSDPGRSRSRGSVILGRAQDRAVDEALDGPWPTHDLWPLLTTPTPLWKRGFDVLAASIGLLVLSPLYLAIAIAIPLDSQGPVIFRQLRAGRGGKPFVFYKFRSMTDDAEGLQAGLAERNEQDGPIFKIHDDPRITRLGRLLRRGSLDELPQLWNVLKGDISLVGPRSPTLNEVAQYERWQRRRLSVAGGITCSWQVSGRSQIPFEEWMRLDMRYVARPSMWLDLRLLLQTLPAVVSSRGAS